MIGFVARADAMCYEQVVSDSDLNQLLDVDLGDELARLLMQIPRGRVTTYGQLAAAAGFPRAARLAGFALKNTPPKMKLPWHRVLNAQGKISFPPRSARSPPCTRPHS